MNLKFSIEKVGRQLLLGRFAGARLGLAHLTDACSQSASAHYPLQRRFTNINAETIVKNCSHAAPADSKEIVILDLSDFLSQIFFSALCRSCFQGGIESAARQSHQSTGGNDAKTFLVSSNCRLNSFFLSSFLLLSRATSKIDSAQISLSRASFTSWKSALRSAGVRGLSAGRVYLLIVGNPVNRQSVLFVNKRHNQTLP